ncbi:spermidine/putrescine ABC transporter substrate-binding protein [Photobacterium sp.]|uniref:polyamine ABC transporter substrate-binding protein n=1 Tax=Photobacterium sp. TaxID=660 RepID=UPI00299F49FB|nr:spermidine/putrescine ABC transporter substrate-binding protein [Photobacterium sp.]MDX1303218.1 spermidine/putrescine ABC transporter substrate-binding protein [Photobacterium sp.]
MTTIKISMISAVLILCSSSFFPQSAYCAEKVLSILNWSEYLDPELVQRFEQQYQAKVVEIYFGSDQQRSEMLLQNNAEGYDLILSSGVDLASYIKRGWLAELEQEKLPTLQHINPEWRSTFSGAEQYAVPYFWGTVGIIYRHDLLEEPITRWQQLYHPIPELRGKIGMFEDTRDLIGMGLKSLGYSANSEESTELKEVEAVLHAQKNMVNSYIYMTLDETSPIVSGTILASMVYNGDAVMVQKHSENLTFVLPEEGGGIWVDYLTIGANAKQPELAYAFLNFINQPENAAQLAQFVCNASPNLAAEKLLPEAFLSNEAIYPDPDSLKKSEFYKLLSADAQRQRNRLAISIIQ